MPDISQIMGNDLIAKSSNSLIQSTKTLEQVPYQLRPTPITSNRCLEKLIGVSCAFNQLVSTGSLKSTFTYNDVTFTNNNDGTITLSGTANADGGVAITSYVLDYIQSHKYYLASVGTSADLKIYDGYPADGYERGNGLIFNWNRANSIGALYAVIKNGVTYSQTIKPMLIDLTALFGSSEVADYLYTLESNTAGSGISLFRQLFPEDYYAYQTASLESSKPTSKKVVGVNQWNEEWEVGGLNASTGELWNTTDRIRSKNYIPVFGGTSYYFKYPISGISANICFYDSNNTFISSVSEANSVITTPTNARYMKFATYAQYGTTYNHDISINLPSTDHNYHAYEEHTYPLGSADLRGLLKVENGNLVAYGDIKPSDGNGTEVFDIVDLGSLDWDYNSGVSVFVSTNDIGEKRTDGITCISDKYIAVNNVSSISSVTIDKTVCFYNNDSFHRLYIKDTDYTDATAFKNSLDGVYLIFEKATPTAKSYTPFSNPMISGSTEEFTDSRSLKMFVGHQSQYYTETEGDKLAALPEMDGKPGDKFVIENSNGKMILKPYADELPAYPSTDGNYRLNVSISDGVITKTWEAIDS